MTEDELDAIAVRHFGGLPPRSEEEESVYAALDRVVAAVQALRN